MHDLFSIVLCSAMKETELQNVRSEGRTGDVRAECRAPSVDYLTILTGMICREYCMMVCCC